jgi:serine/threonine-protein kinase
MIGTRLGNWVIESEIGRGGMSCVYQARADGADAEPPRRAAVKVLAAELAADPGFLLRFQREGEVLRGLDHPHIVRFYEAGAQGGRYYYVMEYVDGRNFDEIRRERGRLPWPEVLALALQACPALKHAHDRGVIHRDLKPSNLLRPTAGGLKLTDFGIAHVFAGDHLTRSGAVVGTAEFLSPEQATGKPVTKRSDLYSLGVVLYTLLTGRTPFTGDSVPELLHKHCYARFEMPRQLVPDIPTGLEEAVCQLLEKDPARRPGDAHVLQRRLERVQDRAGQPDTPTLLETPGPGAPPVPPAGGAEGPATLMSRLMRHELEGQNRGGPVKQFFNRPWVVIPLLLACVGLIVWGFWPPSAEGLFRRGADLMATDDPANWAEAGRRYFDPLDARYPDHPYQKQVEQFRRQIEAARTRRAPTLGQWREWYAERDDLPEPVREFIAREVLGVPYQTRDEMKKGGR